jgi:hypothetical protein
MHKLYQTGDRRLLRNHLIVGFLVALSHGVFLLLAQQGKAPLDEARFTYITIPLALILVISSIAAIVHLSLRAATLKFHAVVLGLSWLGAMYFSIRVALFGVPIGVSFVWNPLIFALVVAYPIYLVPRAFPPLSASKWAAIAPLGAVALSILLSAVIMWRIANAAG